MIYLLEHKIILKNNPSTTLPLLCKVLALPLLSFLALGVVDVLFLFPCLRVLLILGSLSTKVLLFLQKKSIFFSFVKRVSL